MDSIQALTASGWLGTSASEQVTAEKGIGSLSAFGVGATVLADERFDAGDEVLTVNVGDGGVTGIIDAGNVGNVAINGNVNVFNIQNLEGNFDPMTMDELTVKKSTGAAKISYVGDVDTVDFYGEMETVASIKAVLGSIERVFAANDLTSSFLENLIL